MRQVGRDRVRFGQGRIGARGSDTRFGLKAKPWVLGSRWCIGGFGYTDLSRTSCARRKRCSFA